MRKSENTVHSNHVLKFLFDAETITIKWCYTGVHEEQIIQSKNESIYFILLLLYATNMYVISYMKCSLCLLHYKNEINGKHIHIQMHWTLFVNVDRN